MPKDKYLLLLKTSWSVLIICFFIKLLGGNWFELYSENQNYMKFCEWVDTIHIVKVILACLICVVTTYPILCILYDKKYFDWKISILFILALVFKSVFSWYSLLISYTIDLTLTLLLPIIITKNFKKTIKCIILIFLFQFISIFFRNVSFNFNQMNTFVEQSLIQIDYFLMIILFYLYNFKKEG